MIIILFFFFSSRRRHTRSLCDWSSDVCSSDLADPHTADALVSLASARFGRVDYVVAAAGGPHPGRITDLSLEQWLEAFRRSEERRVGKECRSRWSPHD